MKFRNRETDLERELRAQRPQPREQFVQLVSRRPAAPPKVRRPRAPALAFVALVTVVLATSLGVAGALGNASHSVKTFYTSASHIYHWNNSGNVRAPRDPSDPFHLFSFQGQYSHRVPICFQGRQTVFVLPIVAFFLVAFDPRDFRFGRCASGP